jgi:GT2 family glycosyltransferase
LNPDDRVTILEPGYNTGFAGGCNLAVQAARYDTLAFVNSDLIVAKEALAQLVLPLQEEHVGLVTGAVLLPGTPRIINSVGNPINFLMFSWSGCYGEPYEEHGESSEVTGISGALFACKASHWERLGGFDAEFLAYSEDADISLRTWQVGRRVVYASRAVGIHHYEFSPSDQKWFLLERNRLINFFTLYSPGSTVLLLPIFLLVELGILIVSIRGGWWRKKIASWTWIGANRRYLSTRRQRVSAMKSTSEDWTSHLTGSVAIPAKFDVHVPPIVSMFLAAYWRCVSRWMS